MNAPVCPFRQISQKAPSVVVQRNFSQFIKIAKGSSGELRTQLYIARKLHILDASLVDQLVRECKKISGMLEGLRKSLTKSGNKPA